MFIGTLFSDRVDRDNPIDLRFHRNLETSTRKFLEIHLKLSESENADRAIGNQISDINLEMLPYFPWMEIFVEIIVYWNKNNNRTITWLLEGIASSIICARTEQGCKWCYEGHNYICLPKVMWLSLYYYLQYTRRNLCRSEQNENTTKT